MRGEFVKTEEGEEGIGTVFWISDADEAARSFILMTLSISMFNEFLAMFKSVLLLTRLIQKRTTAFLG